MALRNALRLEPADARWAYYLGLANQRRHDSDAAREAFETVLRSRPGDLPTLLRLGRLEIDADRPEEAARWFSSALEVAPGSGAALYGLGQVEQRQGRLEEAVRHLEAAIEAEPGATIAHYPLALAYRDLGDQGQAQAHMALRGDDYFTVDDPLEAELEDLAVGAYYHVARAARAAAAGDMQSAVAGYRQALSQDPGNTEVRLLLAVALARARQVESAKTELRAVIEAEPDNAEAHFLLGTALMAQGDLDGAGASLQRTLSADPRHVEALATLGTLAEQRDDLVAAEYNYSRAVEIDPDNPQNRFQHAKILGLMGRSDESREELVALLERHPSFGEAILSLGFQFEQAEMTDQALERYVAASELSDQPDVQGMAFVRIVELTARSGRAPTADQLPQVLPEYVAMANSLARMGRYAEAAEAFDTAVGLGPGSRGSGDTTAGAPGTDLEGAHMGRALSRLYAGQDSQARGEIEQSLEAFPRNIALAHLLARLMATSSDATIRDGQRALALAQQVAQAEERIDHVETVAMALAELGRYQEAADLQRRILSEARRVGATPLIPDIEARLRLYESGQPVRDVWKS